MQKMAADRSRWKLDGADGTVLIYNPDMANQAITWLIKGHKN